MLAGAGDELQGIKKGIIEMADAIVITKADEDNIQNAKRAPADFQHALHLLPSKTSGWSPPVTTCSSVTNQGISDIWKLILKFKSKTSESGFFDQQRNDQNVQWFNEYFQQLLLSDFQKNEKLQKNLKTLSLSVHEQKLSPYAAASQLLADYHRSLKD